MEDSFKIIHSKPKPLAAYLFTNDEQLKKDFVQNISSGGMLINDTILHVITLFLISYRKDRHAQFLPI
jgi:aldehyde dehydrogenase (NAD+)